MPNANSLGGDVQPCPLVTVSEVGLDAGLCGASHVTHGGQAAAGGGEEGQHQGAPGLPLHPVVQLGPQALGRGHARAVQHRQQLGKQAAGGHVSLLQVRLCERNTPVRG